jgi:quinol monooxygenase YgiN
MRSEHITVVISYHAQAGQSGIARIELETLIAQVVANEAACLGITLHQNEDDDTQFLLYEKWTDRATYLGPHMKTPYIEAFIKKAPSFMAERPAITFWR